MLNLLYLLGLNLFEPFLFVLQEKEDYKKHKQTP